MIIKVTEIKKKSKQLLFSGKINILSCVFSGSCENWKVIESSSESKSTEVRTTSSKKGKALFQRCAEKQEEEEAKNMVETSQVLPGVDLEEIEDEFERLHKEMMGDSD